LKNSTTPHHTTLHHISSHYLPLFLQAPHWVDGYHDIIFDAMARMEGAELKPTTEIYSAIIYAFGRGGDTVAAEFYFWEMKRKGSWSVCYETVK
jgi:pentatricopeptide repeat protein